MIAYFDILLTSYEVVIACHTYCRCVLAVDGSSIVAKKLEGIH